MLHSVYTRVYTPDSYNPINQKFNGESEEDILGKSTDADHRRIVFTLHAHSHYSRSHITMLAAFLGLPNYREFGRAQTWSNIGRNFLGWQTIDFKNKSKKAIAFAVAKNIGRMLLVAPVNLLVSLIQIPRNLIKLVTEFLPLTCAMMLGFALYHINEKIKTLPYNKRLGLNIVYGFLWLLKMAALGIHFVGRALTSPVKGVLAAYQAGKDLNGKNRGGRFLGVVFAASSVCISIAVYAFLFPFIFTAASTAISTSFTANMLAVFSNLPSLSTLGAVLLGPGFYSAFSAMGAATAAMTALASIGGLFAAALTILGTPFSKFVLDKITHFWNTYNQIPLDRNALLQGDVIPESSTTHKMNQSLIPENNSKTHIPPQEPSEFHSASEEDSEQEKKAIIDDLIKRYSDELYVSDEENIEIELDPIENDSQVSLSCSR